MNNHSIVHSHEKKLFPCKKNRKETHKIVQKEQLRLSLAFFASINTFVDSDIRNTIFFKNSKCGLFGGSLLLGLEVTTDADAVEVAIDAEREHAVPVFEPVDGK